VGTLNLDLLFWLASAGAFLVGLSKGGLPSIGMLAVPILSLVMSPVKAAVMLLPIFVLSDGVGIWLYRRDFSLPNLRILVPAGIVGVVIGWCTASLVSERVITFLIGLMGVSFCLNVWLRKSQAAQARPVQRLQGYFWGAVSGFTSFISHSGGPPFQVYILPQKLAKAQFAGTATLFFAVINAAKILPYQLLRPYTLDALYESAFLVPAALLGTLAGAYLNRKLADKWFFLVVQLALFGVSLKLLVDASGCLS
jgi:uncharacterized membrane protein YfcA